MFAVVTHSRLRGPHVFPRMLGATLEIRRDLRRARGLIRAANVIAGPTEFVTLTTWLDRDDMYAFMRSGAHERIMWSWPRWLSAFWLTRMAPTEHEVGRWRGTTLGRLATAGGPGHSAFAPPEFASRDPRPRELEHLGLAATTTVIRPAAAARWGPAIAHARHVANAARRMPGLVRGTWGYSLDRRARRHRAVALAGYGAHRAGGDGSRVSRDRALVHDLAAAR